GLETTPQEYSEPFRTPFAITTSTGPIVTFYFRTEFVLGDPKALAGLLATTYVDDGAVWYINGLEAGRVRLSSAIPVDGMEYTNIPTPLSTEGPPPLVSLPLTHGAGGTNPLAVELHQGPLPISDAVFGMSMVSLPLLTNAPSFPPPQPLGDGNVRLTLN